MTQAQIDYQTSSDRLGVGEHITRVGSDLVEALGSVLADVPGAPSRPQALAKQLVLNKDLTSRLVRALRKSDPVEALYVMPGPTPLRRVLKSASKAGVSQGVISRAASAIEAFDELIRTEFGARADLDAAISHAHPEARERHESTAKQLAYRGASGLRGISVDVMLVTFLVHPSRVDPGSCDTAVINAYIGLRRTRPGAHFEFTTFQESRYGAADVGAVGGGAAQSGAILTQFCSPPELPLKVIPAGEKVRYVMTEHGIGQSSALDIVTQEFYAKNHPLTHKPGMCERRWFFATADQPAVLMVFDLLVHQDVWPGCDPALEMYDTAVKGIAIPTDDTREGDRLDLAERITPITNGRYATRVPEAPSYAGILDHVCERHAWDLQSFRGYRARIGYPFHGSQVCMIFSPFEAKLEGNRATGRT